MSRDKTESIARRFLQAWSVGGEDIAIKESGIVDSFSLLQQLQ